MSRINPFVPMPRNFVSLTYERADVPRFSRSAGESGISRYGFAYLLAQYLRHKITGDAWDRRATNARAKD